MPPSYHDWRNYLQDIANNIKKHGWIVVSTTGLPFFYYDLAGKGCAEAYIPTGPRGHEFFFSILGGTGIESISTVVNLTLEGKRISKIAGVFLSHQISISRCIFVQGISPEVIFYGIGMLCGAGAFHIGNGFFIHNGFMSPDFGMMPSRWTDEYLGKLCASYVLGLKRPRNSPIDTDLFMQEVATVLQNYVRVFAKNRKPRNEPEVRTWVENILQIRGYKYDREKRRHPFITTSSQPDFVLREYKIPIEVELIKSKDQVNEKIKEISTHATQFKAAYQRAIFLVSI